MYLCNIWRFPTHNCVSPHAFIHDVVHNSKQSRQGKCLIYKLLTGRKLTQSGALHYVGCGHKLYISEHIPHSFWCKNSAKIPCLCVGLEAYKVNVSQWSIVFYTLYQAVFFGGKLDGWVGNNPPIDETLQGNNSRQGKCFIYKLLTGGSSHKVGIA